MKGTKVTGLLSKKSEVLFFLTPVAKRDEKLGWRRPYFMQLTPQRVFRTRTQPSHPHKYLPSQLPR